MTGDGSVSLDHRNTRSRRGLKWCRLVQNITPRCQHLIRLREPGLRPLRGHNRACYFCRRLRCSDSLVGLDDFITSNYRGCMEVGWERQSPLATPLPPRQASREEPGLAPAPVGLLVKIIKEPRPQGAGARAPLKGTRPIGRGRDAKQTTRD